MQAICWLRPEIFFSYRNYLTIFTKNNASHRKAQVLIVSRKLEAFLQQIMGKKCNMRYKSFVREADTLSASQARHLSLTLRPSFYKRKRRKNCWSC